MNRIKSILFIGLPILVLALCVVGFLFAPNDPNHVDLSSKFIRPCGEYPFGTDHLGRCILSRILYGGKTTIGIVLVGSAIVVFIGTTLGLLLGQSRQGQNIFIESVLNAVTALPPIAYLIIFIGAWGNGVSTMMTALTISLIMRLIKLVKTETEIELRKAYILCAVTSGSKRLHLLFVHVLPNIIRDIIHFVCLSCTDMVMAIVGFSFIGLGLGDNIIDWGIMVSEARGITVLRPDIILYPVCFIFLSTLSFNLIAREIERMGGFHA